MPAYGQILTISRSKSELSDVKGKKWDIYIIYIGLLGQIKI